MKCILSLLLCCMLQLAASAQGQTGEAKVSLNGSWAFKTDPNNVGAEQ